MEQPQKLDLLTDFLSRSMYPYISEQLSIRDTMMLALCSSTLYQMVSEDDFIQACKRICVQTPNLTTKIFDWSKLSDTTHKLAYIASNQENVRYMCKVLDMCTVRPDFKLENYLRLVLGTICVVGNPECLEKLIDRYIDSDCIAKAFDFLFGETTIEEICDRDHMCILLYLLGNHQRAYHTSSAKWMLDMCKENSLLGEENGLSKFVCQYAIKNNKIMLLKRLLKWSQAKLININLQYILLHSAAHGGLETFEFLFEEIIKMPIDTQRYVHAALIRCSSVEKQKWLLNKILNIGFSFERSTYLFGIIAHKVTHLEDYTDFLKILSSKKTKTYSREMSRLFSDAFSGKEMIEEKHRIDLLLLNFFPEEIIPKPINCQIILESGDTELMDVLLDLNKFSLHNVDIYELFEGIILHVSKEHTQEILTKYEGRNKTLTKLLVNVIFFDEYMCSNYQAMIELFSKYKFIINPNEFWFFMPDNVCLQETEPCYNADKVVVLITSANKVLGNGNVSDENVSDENVSDENVADENVSDENVLFQETYEMIMRVMVYD